MSIGLREEFRQYIGKGIYLVTDEGLLPDGAEFIEHINDALRAGVRVVQLREKTASGQKFYDRARKLKDLVHSHGGILIINDRIDVAIAVDADGIHVGQDDIPVEMIRKIAPRTKFIGLTVNTINDLERALNADVTYVGIGALNETNTKQLSVPPCGVRGCRDIMNAIVDRGSDIVTVAIGGLHLHNLSRIRFQTTINRTQNSKNIEQCLDMAAVVSAIMASKTPTESTEELNRKWAQKFRPVAETQLEDIITLSDLSSSLSEERPLVHHMTNNVVKNFSANVTLAIGASPIMSEAPEEVEAISSVLGALVLNLGQISSYKLPTMLKALETANRGEIPVVFDPVGAGASEFRLKSALTILEKGYCSVIKGNVGELSALWYRNTGTMRGVDSAPAEILKPMNETRSDNMELARDLSLRERCIVVCTGKEDYVASQGRVYINQTGHRYLGQITGSGCSLGSMIAACCAVNRTRMFAATSSAVHYYGQAASRAASNSNCSGPGTFVPLFLDELSESLGSNK